MGKVEARATGSEPFRSGVDGELDDSRIPDSTVGTIVQRIRANTVRRMRYWKRWPDRNSYTLVVEWMLSEVERIHPEEVKRFRQLGYPDASPAQGTGPTAASTLPVQEPRGPIRAGASGASRTPRVSPTGDVR